jgi:hypothetical protein
MPKIHGIYTPCGRQIAAESEHNSYTTAEFDPKWGYWYGVLYVNRPSRTRHGPIARFIPLVRAQCGYKVAKVALRRFDNLIAEVRHRLAKAA